MWFSSLFSVPRPRRRAGRRRSVPLPPPKKKARKTVEEEDPKLFKTKVHAILKKVAECSTGEFAVSGELKESPICAISLKNNGNLTFPLMDPEAANIIKAFEQSPFGRGTQTLVDTTVRNSWQLNPKGFDILNSKWNAYVNKTVIAQVGTDMGIKAPFAASLYKLLLYKTGSFFKTHRDSEKENGMFATLVIQLPSKYKGGELVVSHDGKSKTFDFSSKGRLHREFSCYYSAFYCDCEHEILPVTEGYRVCLIYNLLWTGSDSIPVAPKTSGFEEELMKLFEEWQNGDVLEPSKLIYCFSHKYTEKNVSFNNLKTSDKAVATFLQFLANKCCMALKLGFFEKDSQGHESGFNEFDSDDEDCYAEKIYSVKKLISLDDQKRFPTLTSLPVEFEMEVIPPNCCDELEPYKSKRKNTGNEGVAVELHYRSTALVFWPENNILEVLQESSRDDEVEQLFLTEFNQNFKKKDEKLQKRLLRWAKTVSYFGSIEERGSVRNQNIIPLFKAFIAFDNLELLKAFIKSYYTLDSSTIPLVVSQCEKYGWNNFSTLLVDNFKRNHPNSYYQEEELEEHLKSLERLKLLSDAAAATQTYQQAKAKQDIFSEMLKSILECSKRCFLQKSKIFPLCRLEQDKDAEFVKKIVEKSRLFYNSLCAFAEQLDVSLLEYSIDKRFDVVVPVLIKLAHENSTPGTLDKKWLDIAKHFVEKMEEVISKTLESPKWDRKGNQWGCTCKDCVAVIEFLDSKSEYQRFPLGQARCNHVEDSIRYIFKELSVKVEKTGNTATLVLTKTKKDFSAQCSIRDCCNELLPKLKAIIPPSETPSASLL